MKLVVIAVQPMAELFIAALGTGMLLILDSPFFTYSEGYIHYVLLASRELHYVVKFFFTVLSCKISLLCMVDVGMKLG